MSETADYVSAYLREADRERYFASLFVPAARRSSVQALFAFNADVASIPARAREPQAGEIRLQWWVDAFEGEAHGAVRQNPLAAALLDALATDKIPAGALARLLRARRFDLYHDAMPDLASFEGYAGETESVLFQLSAMMLNEGAELPGDAAGHIGVARALTGHLRAFGYNASQGRLFLPLEVFVANGVREDQIFAGKDSAELRAALVQINDIARDHLDKGLEALPSVPKPARPAFALAALMAKQLDIYRQHAQPFAVPPDLSDWRKLVRMAWWGLRA